MSIISLDLCHVYIYYTYIIWNAIQKSNNIWGICINYTHMNKVCSKDHNPLSNTNQLIDITSQYQILIFLDDSLSYHQILMNADGISKTAVITPKETYKPISRCLLTWKMRGQKMLNQVFNWWIYRGNMEYNVNDMTVKSLFRDHHENLRDKKTWQKKTWNTLI